MKTIADILRKLTQWLDPQPMTIELCMLSKPVANPDKIQGIPTMYWKLGDNGILLYPSPERDFKLLIRL